MRGGDWFLAACIVAGVSVLCALGFWQVERLAWKEAMIARAETNSRGTPVPLPEIERRKRAGEDIEYVPVTVSGTFDHDDEQYYFATYKGRGGWYVYTPLMLEDGRALWVNRGFVPPELRERETRTDGLVQGTVTIEGLSRDRIDEKPNVFVPDNDLAKRNFYWKSLSQMAANAYDETKVATVDFFVDARADQTPAWPVGGVTRITFPNNHLQYAVTWFGLAATLLLIGGLLLWRRVTRRVDVIT